MRNRFLVPTFLAVSILMVGVISTSVVSAQVSSYPPVVERLAERFGLDKGEVKQFFDEVHSEHQADMYASWVERLDDLVAQGDITSEQKEELLTKLDEMREKIEALQDLDPETRHEDVVQIRQEFRDWAKAQEIDLSSIKPFGGRHHHGGFGGLMKGFNN